MAGDVELPGVIPIFPLPNVVLFPGVPLPLHIFEERYRDMVADAVASPQPMIGMVLLRGDWKGGYHGRPQVYPVGCVGRLVQSDRLEDGRYNILLRGTREFTVEDEVGDTRYRQARVRWRPPPADGLNGDEREDLISLADELVRQNDPTTADRLFSDDSMSDELLVNFLSYALDFPPIEKLALLQAAAITNRAHRLRELLQLTIAEVGSGGGSDGWIH